MPPESIITITLMRRVINRPIFCYATPRRHKDLANYLSERQSTLQIYCLNPRQIHIYQIGSHTKGYWNIFYNASGSSILTVYSNSPCIPNKIYLKKFYTPQVLSDIQRGEESFIGVRRKRY